MSVSVDQEGEIFLVVPSCLFDSLGGEGGRFSYLFSWCLLKSGRHGWSQGGTPKALRERLFWKLFIYFFLRGAGAVAWWLDGCVGAVTGWSILKQLLYWQSVADPSCRVCILAVFEMVCENRVDTNSKKGTPSQKNASHQQRIRTRYRLKREIRSLTQVRTFCLWWKPTTSRSTR